MDTISTITVLSASPDTAQKAIDAGFAQLTHLETLINYYSPDSEISAVNRAAGKSPVAVSEATLDIVSKAVTISRMTNGAFNPAVGPLMKLWKFSRQEIDRPLPSRDTILSSLKLVDYRKIRVDTSSSEIYLEEEGMEIDLGGIAKGYGADKAVEAIRLHGVRSALVSIAGDIRGFGLKNDQKPWKVGVQDPRSGQESPEKEGYQIVTTIELRNSAVSTSGDYQRFFIKEGKRYHHIIDPRTGYPTESSLMSVTVLAPEGFMADALSTGVFILGPHRGRRLLESAGFDGILIDTDRRIYPTEQLKRRISILQDGYSLAE